MDTYKEKVRAFSSADKFNQTKTTLEDILNKTIKAGGTTGSSAILNQKDLYFAIHVLEYGDTPSVVKSDSWYLYRHDISFKQFTRQRVYGSKNVVVLFLHLNAKGLDSDGLKSLAKAEQDAFAAKLLYDSDPKNHLQIQALGDGAIDSSFAQVHYEAAVVKKTPANIQNLLSILKILGVAQGEIKGEVQVTTKPVIVWGAGAVQDVAAPSDIHVAGYGVVVDDPTMANARDSNRLGADVTLNNEGKYWWDASIGIPVHKIKDLQYSSSDNTVVAKQVDKQSAYAMFNLMPRPIDLSAPGFNFRFLVGFPLASSPWDKLFAGGAVGLPWKPFQNFQFFAGATFIRDTKPATLTAGSTATNAQLQNDLRIRTTPKLTIGINVPVKSVIDKLK